MTAEEFCRDKFVICDVKDTVIYERLEGDQPLKDVTLKHLEDFANIGWHNIVLVFSPYWCREYLAVSYTHLTLPTILRV